MTNLESILAEFDTVSLEETEEVKLMNRIDRKYWFHDSVLLKLLEQIYRYYDILEINGQRLMEYQTVYYDTPGNRMYLNHHNRKLNRYKVRKRNYCSTNSSFFEIKRKTNKKRTVKVRIPAEFDEALLQQAEKEFVEANTIYRGDILIPVVQNYFQRITLIHKDKCDRCTIDLHPGFSDGKNEVSLEGLVIFELKRGRSLKSSPMVSILRALKIRQRGLSKYCTGRGFLDSGLKQNAFKSRLRYLYKQQII